MKYIIKIIEENVIKVHVDAKSESEAIELANSQIQHLSDMEGMTHIFSAKTLENEHGER